MKKVAKAIVGGCDLSAAGYRRVRRCNPTPATRPSRPQAAHLRQRRRRRDPVKTGLKYVAFTTAGIDVNMQPRRIDVEFTDLMTSNSVPIDFHAVLDAAGDGQREAGAGFRSRRRAAAGRRGSGCAISISRFAPPCAMP